MTPMMSGERLDRVLITKSHNYSARVFRAIATRLGDHRY